MAGMLQEGFVGRLGRFAHTKTPFAKKLFGEQGTDLLGVYSKDPPNPYAEQFGQVTKEPNRKGVRKRRQSPSVNSPLTPADTRTQYNILGGK